MNGIRCVIRLSRFETPTADMFVGRFGPVLVGPRFCGQKHTRRFGSHTEAKRELKCWIDAYPNVKIVDEAEL